MIDTLRRCMRDAVLNPAWICFVWFGLVAGVSLLATPVKFTAPSITRPIALDVGRVTFSLLNKAEIVALVLLLAVVWLSGHARRWWGVCVFLGLIVLAQTVWLLPELTTRTEMILAGTEPPPSYLHAAYSTLELVKLGTLIVTGFVALSEQK